MNDNTINLGETLKVKDGQMYRFHVNNRVGFYTLGKITPYPCLYLYKKPPALARFMMKVFFDIHWRDA